MSRLILLKQKLLHVAQTFARKPERSSRFKTLLAERVNDKSTMAYALRHLAGFYEERGELDRAIDFHRRCLALREAIGLQRLGPYALLAIGELEVKKGDYAGARATYERALARAHRAGRAGARPGGRGLSGYALRAGRRDRHRI